MDKIMALLGSIALMLVAFELKKHKERIEVLEYQLEKLKSQSKEP